MRTSQAGSRRLSGEVKHRLSYTEWGGMSSKFVDPESATVVQSHTTLANEPSGEFVLKTSTHHREVKPDYNLIHDEVLLSAPRITLNGYQVPVLGGIHLLSKIGQGGMGAVYYGIHPRLDQEVAVKVLLQTAQQIPAAVQRFIREARLAFSVRSPHLISVIDVNEENGLFYLVMEYVYGQSATWILTDYALCFGKSVPEEVALSICIGAATGLEAAHLKNVIHRDVKPDNILVPYLEQPSSSRTGRMKLDYKAAKLLDLGLARKELRTKEASRTTLCMGTRGYMAPEQMEDASQVGKPADVFGLGATLYTLLGGEPPRRDPSQKHALIAHTKLVPFQSIKKLNPSVSDSLASLLDRCLSLKPENRPADATALLAELSAVRQSFEAPSTSRPSGEWCV